MSEQTVQQIPLTRIIPFRGVNGKGQPRTHFDQKALEELAQSMRTAGFIDPILCRPIEGGIYETIGGHRRCKAAALAGLGEVSAVVRDMTNAEALMIVVIDNLNREAYLPWEEGSGYADLLDSGLTIGEVAARAGKSPSFVSGRIAIHEGLGATARDLYLRKELTIAALELLAALPDRVMSPVRCPSCRVVCREDLAACPACGADLSAVPQFPSGNPQEAAAKLCRGKVNGTVPELVERVKETYGLSEAPIQTSLGLDDQQITEEAVKVRTALERKLSDVADLGDYFLKHLEALKQYTPDQRAAVADKCAVAERLFARIRQVAAPEPLALAL